LNLKLPENGCEWLSLRNKGNVNLIEGNIQYIDFFNVNGTYSIANSSVTRRNYPTTTELYFEKCSFKSLHTHKKVKIIARDSTFEFFSADNIHELKLLYVNFGLLEKLSFQNNDNYILQMNNVYANSVELFILKSPAEVNGYFINERASKFK